MVPGGQLHTAWWRRPMQVAVTAQVSRSQTGRQTRFRRSQASWSAQSSLYWHTPATHDKKGSPCVPAGQTHCARWACTRHSAPRPQRTAPCTHGLRQLPSMHALSYTQSVSALHCAAGKRARSKRQSSARSSPGRPARNARLRATVLAAYPPGASRHSCTYVCSIGFAGCLPNRPDSCRWVGGRTSCSRRPGRTGW